MRLFSRFRIFSGIMGAVALALTLVATPAHAAVSTWQKGVTYQPFSTTELSSDGFHTAMQRAKADGANYVTLVVQLHQTNVGSTDVYTAGDTPSDDSLANGIQYVHSLGMKVMIKPHVDSYDYQWRAFINPGDRNAWFTSYGNLLTHYAQISAQNGVEELCIGSELVDMTRPDKNPTNTTNWNNLITRVKSVYSGPLTYSAQRADGSGVDEVSFIQFWNRLDYIGVSAYYPLNGSSVATMESDWGNIDRQFLSAASAKWNKPLLFTEIGYRSADNAASAPFDGPNGSANQGLQANLYQALFEYWNTSPIMVGVQLWDWNSSGDTSYNPQNKQAEAVLKTWYGGTGTSTGGGTTTPPTTTPANTNPGTINSSATAPATATVGQSVTATASVTPQTTASNITVDVEVYDQNGTRVLQQYVENQTLTAGQAYTKAVSFTPTSAGNYSVKIGVFSTGWATNYSWNNGAITVVVSNASTTPPVTPPPATTPPPVTTPPPTTAPSLANATLSVWWPSNGSSVSGVQPFKARLDGVDNSAYKMSWQVDGGGLVAMGDDNTAGAVHKESLVDLSGWNWQPSGSYVITFVATDLNGNVMKKQSVTITITH